MSSRFRITDFGASDNASAAIESAADERHVTMLGVGKSFQNLGCQCAQIVNAVVPCNHDDDRNIERGNVLLMERLRSAVRDASNSAAAKASSSPFRLLAHPISGTVLASWPTSSRFKRLGRHSSSRTRPGEERLLGLL